MIPSVSWCDDSWMVLYRQEPSAALGKPEPRPEKGKKNWYNSRYWLLYQSSSPLTNHNFIFSLPNLEKLTVFFTCSFHRNSLTGQLLHGLPGIVGAEPELPAPVYLHMTGHITDLHIHTLFLLGTARRALFSMALYYQIFSTINRTFLPEKRKEKGPENPGLERLILLFCSGQGDWKSPSAPKAQAGPWRCGRSIPG